MIDAYIDESGIHDGAAVCVVAGYYGGRGQWKKFEKAWKRELNSAGMSLNEFHAKDLLKKDDERYKKLARNLAETIRDFRRKIHPVSMGIIVGDFSSFPDDVRKFLTGATLEVETGNIIGTGSPNKAYYVAFQHCLRRILSCAPIGGKAHFFFGLDRTFSAYAAELYQKAKSNPDWRFKEQMGDISFPEAKSTSQLQAADLLVHLTYQYALTMIERHSWGELPPGPLLADAIAGTVHPLDHSYMDRTHLELTLTKGIEDFYAGRG